MITPDWVLVSMLLGFIAGLLMGICLIRQAAR